MKPGYFHLLNLEDVAFIQGVTDAIDQAAKVKAAFVP